MKPKIDELFQAIQQFHIATTRAGFNKIAWKLAQEEFQARMKVLDIYDCFDWTEEE